MDQKVFGDSKLTPTLSFLPSANLADLSELWGIKKPKLNWSILPESTVHLIYKTLQNGLVKDHVFNQLTKILNKNNIEVSDSDFILDYLTNYPKLLDVMNNICNETRKAFGPESLLSLRKHQECDSISCYPALYVKSKIKKENPVSLVRKILRKHVYGPLNKDEGWITIRIDE